MSKDTCNHSDYRPPVKSTDERCGEIARETRAVFAATIVAAKDQLRREELRASLHLGLTVAGAYDHAEQFADAPATCEQLRKEIFELEERVKGLDVAVDFLEAARIKREISDRAPRLEAANQAVNEYPDRENLEHTKRRHGAAVAAVRSGISLAQSQESLLEVDAKTCKRIADYDSVVNAANTLREEIGGIAVGLINIRAKYGDLAAIVVQP